MRTGGWTDGLMDGWMDTAKGVGGVPGSRLLRWVVRARAQQPHTIVSGLVAALAPDRIVFGMCARHQQDQRERWLTCGWYIIRTWMDETGNSQPARSGKCDWRAAHANPTSLSRKKKSKKTKKASQPDRFILCSNLRRCIPFPQSGLVLNKRLRLRLLRQA
jgi:hypothetical protein